MKFALAGNQNCGKTTLFNALTGSNQHVGNFPGVTVDSKTGIIKNTAEFTKDKETVSIVDLPGIYSLRPFSAEEIVTRDYILKQNPDAIINIIDATNIERNLYLTLQLLELKVPTVIAVNMMDEFRGNGGFLDVKKFSELLGVPVVPISAVKNEGTTELTKAAINVAKKHILPKVEDFCSEGAMHRAIHSLSLMIEDHAANISMPPRFVAVKLIEGDSVVEDALGLDDNEKDMVEHSKKEIVDETSMDCNEALAEARYEFIESVVKNSVKKCCASKEFIRSMKIDKVLTNKYFAIPIFIAIMILIFWLTFDVIGSFLSDWLAYGIDWLSQIVDKGLLNYGINPVVESLVIDGIFSGVGSVLSFLPIVVTLFFFLSVLEDTGYMARVAFVMDKLLRKIGLSGKSIVPMLIGFGCTVPAVMATRTLSSDRDRKMTVLLTPYMSCSAKIPIYAVFTAAFFENYKALVMMCLYLTGILLSIIVASVLKKTMFKGNPIPFVMELPNYRIPSLKSVMLLLWEKAKDFLQRAFTVILLATIVIWFLETFDTRFNVVSDSSTSLLASIGRFLTPVFVPLGFGDWRAVTSLIAGFTAKEAVISTMQILGNIADMFTPLSAMSFLVFTLLYTPCVAAISTFNKELQSKSKTFGVVVLQCTIAWICSFAVYQIGSLIVR